MMGTPFARSIRMLQHDGSRPWLAVVLGLLLALAAWLGWSTQGRISIYVTSTSAHLSVHGRVHRIASPVLGTVSEVLVDVGDPIVRGQPIVRLDTRPQELHRAEVQARRAGLGAELGPVRRELEALQHGLLLAGRAAELERLESEADVDATRSLSRFARRQAERLDALHGGGHVSDSEHDDASATAAQSRAVLRAREHRRDRADAEHRVELADREAEIQRLVQRESQLAGELEVAHRSIARIEAEIERAHLRSPIDGSVGDLAALRSGSVVQPGEWVASVVPDGELRVLADLAPADALGHVRPGQAAIVRLDGFPWTQYGTLSARVRRVASDAHDGTIRAELELLDGTAGAIPLQHGLPGVVEIEVERIAPLVLLLRALGQWVSGGEAHAEREEPR
jgi:multidrug resistance efflux pump